MLSTEGIIFKQTRYKESSLILDIYTREAGLISCIINGVYSKTSQRLASVLQLMNIVLLDLYYSEHKAIHRIKEVNPRTLYQKIPFDIHRSAIGTFLLEVLRNALKNTQANEALFDFIKDRFVQLDTDETLNPNFHLVFLLDLSYYLGFNPLDNYSETDTYFDVLNGHFCAYDPNNTYQLSQEESELFIQLIRKKIPASLKTLHTRRMILQKLLQFYKVHLDQFKDIRSMEVFKDIL